MPLTLSDDDANNLVSWLSEIGDLSYAVAPDPSPIGVGIRERVISSKHILHADPPPPPAPPSPAPRLMYDSVTASDIPATAVAVAGYLDGLYMWTAADWGRFPNAAKVTITVLGNPVADVADVENGDLSPVQGAQWIKNRIADGIPGPHVIYCNLSTLPSVRAECTGLPASYWIADWTSNPHIPDGDDILACQFADATQNGAHWDLSLCRDANWPK